MAWVNARVWSATVNQKVFGYSTGTSTTLSRFTLISRSGTGGQLQVGGRALDADAQRTLNSTTALSTGDWHHVVGIVDYANALGWIYIDGALDVFGALSGTLGAAQTENTNSLSVGIGVREGGGGGGQQGITGFIDDFRLYDGILGPDIIKTIHAARGHDKMPNDLLHHYPLNDFGPGIAVVNVACTSMAERLVGTAIGAPTFDVGTLVARGRPVGGVGMAI
jgi:hypothetical protein